MIFDYILVLLRHLKKQAGTAIINIASYGFGLAACLVLFQYIHYEASYDKLYPDHESIYRIAVDEYYGGVYQNSTAFSFLPIGPELKHRYPEVQAFTVASLRLEVVTVDSMSFFEKRVLVADTGYFSVFSQVLTQGSTNAAGPNDVFISETMAAKYFGDGEALGKTMKVFRDLYTVKGVFQDLPANTHLKFDILCLVPVRGEGNGWGNDWNVPHMYTYVKLKDGPEEFSSKLKSFSEEFSKVANQQSEGDFSFALRLQPLTSIHLQSAMLDEAEINGKLDDIYILLVVAVLILIVTCFNYINLTNAINSVRTKEVFIRKIHGASYLSSFTQRVVESITLNSAGFAAALAFLFVFVRWVGPYFDFPLIAIGWSATLGYLLLIIFIAALFLSGILPALLTSFTVATRLPARTSAAKGSFNRNIAFIQFTVSCILISGSLVVLKQIWYMRDGDHGFTDDGVLALEINALNYHQNEEFFLRAKADLEKIASVDRISYSSCVPGERLINTSIRLSTGPVGAIMNCDVQVVTSDYFSVYGLEVVEGRVFSEGDPSDALTVVVNESLANELSGEDGESVINKEVTVDWARAPVKFRIVGVIKDYNHYSKKQGIKPMLFIQLKNTFAVFRISVKKAGDVDWKAIEPSVQKALKDNFTVPYAKRGVELAFDVVEVRSAYNSQYRGDEQFSKFLNALTFLAISMAGIGFFSLASLTTRRRIKEMAIRKVCGAQVADISVLISGYFFRLAGLAFLIGMPLSYFFVQSWLKQFPTRVAMGAWFVLWPLVITVGLIVLSISYFVLKLVLVEPTRHLRSE